MHYRFTLTVPNKDNAGKDIDREHWEKLRDDIIKYFGGYSALSIAGQWRDDSGEIINDFSTRFEMLIESGGFAEKWWWMHDLAKYVKLHWQQESVLITRETVPEVKFI